MEIAVYLTFCLLGYFLHQGFSHHNLIKLIGPVVGIYWVVGKVMARFMLFYGHLFMYKVQRSVNDILPVLFDNLLPSDSKFHSSSFVEGPVFYHYHYSTRGILKRVKQVEV